MFRALPKLCGTESTTAANSVGNDQIFKRGVFITFTVSLPNVNFTVASVINDFGQIVGIHGTSQADDQEFGFLATPSYTENYTAQAE